MNAAVSTVSAATGQDAGLACSQVVEVFHRLFERDYRTRLQGGAEEPLYRPAAHDGDHHCIFFTRNYTASALHEIAHWCVAGEQRRLQEDYGYWYEPDGRSAAQQALFEQVEVKPQAFEWVFSVAAGRPFRVSADNLQAGLGASEAFKDRIYQQLRTLCEQGLPTRARQFAEGLARRSGVAEPFASYHYRRSEL